MGHLIFFSVYYSAFYTAKEAQNDSVEWLWGSREEKKTLQSDLCIWLFEVGSTDEAIASMCLNSNPVNISAKKSGFMGCVLFSF